MSEVPTEFYKELIDLIDSTASNLSIINPHVYKASFCVDYMGTPVLHYFRRRADGSVTFFQKAQKSMSLVGLIAIEIDLSSAFSLKYIKSAMGRYADKYILFYTSFKEDATLVIALKHVDYIKPSQGLELSHHSKGILIQSVVDTTLRGPTLSVSTDISILTGTF